MSLSCKSLGPKKAIGHHSRGGGEVPEGRIPNGVDTPKNQRGYGIVLILDRRRLNQSKKEWWEQQRRGGRYQKVNITFGPKHSYQKGGGGLVVLMGRLSSAWKSCNAKSHQLQIEHESGVKNNCTK